MKATPLLLTASLTANLIAGWLLWKNQTKPHAIEVTPLISFQPPEWPTSLTYLSLLSPEVPLPPASQTLLDVDLTPPSDLIPLLLPHTIFLPSGPIRIDFGQPTTEDRFNDSGKPILVL
jgi:hypothetical protein